LRPRVELGGWEEVRRGALRGVRSGSVMHAMRPSFGATDRQYRPRCLQRRALDGIDLPRLPDRPRPRRPEPARPRHGLEVPKYGHHLPLTRQSAIHAREASRSTSPTLADWVGAAAATAMPLVSAASTSAGSRTEAKHLAGVQQPLGSQRPMTEGLQLDLGVRFASGPDRPPVAHLRTFIRRRSARRRDGGSACGDRATAVAQSPSSSQPVALGRRGRIKGSSSSRDTPRAAGGGPIDMLAGVCAKEGGGYEPSARSHLKSREGGTV
jgi:hypothetical protein